MVGGAVFCHQPASINTEGHRQVLRRHVMDHLVIGPLQERRIHGDHRSHALCRKTAGKGDRMLFRDAHVIQPIREFLFKDGEAGPFAHGGRDRDDPRVPLGQFDERIDRDRGVGGARRLLGRFTGLSCKGRAGVKPDRILHGRLVAKPFFRDHMEQHRTFQPEDILQCG